MIKVYSYYYPGWTSSRLIDEWSLLDSGPKFYSDQRRLFPKQRYYLDQCPETIITQAMTAKAAGIDGFIFCWYWDQGNMVLQEALDCLIQSDLDFSFAVMWVNRKPNDDLPVGKHALHGDFYQPASNRNVDTNIDDAIAMMSWLKAHCFSDSRYIKINGRPYFSIFSMMDFFRSFGGYDSLDQGFFKKLYPDVYLACIAHCAESWVEDGTRLGIDALTNYVLLPDWRGPMRQEYSRQAHRASCHWNYITEVAGMQYHPSITVGWDATPRCDPSVRVPPKGFPWRPVVMNSTPFHIAQHLKRGIEWCEKYNSPHLVLASWNEWSEGHVLEPNSEDIRILDAISNVLNNR